MDEPILNQDWNPQTSHFKIQPESPGQKLKFRINNRPEEHRCDTAKGWNTSTIIVSGVLRVMSLRCPVRCIRDSVPSVVRINSLFGRTRKFTHVVSLMIIIFFHHHFMPMISYQEESDEHSSRQNTSGDRLVEKVRTDELPSPRFHGMGRWALFHPSSLSTIRSSRGYRVILSSSCISWKNVNVHAFNPWMGVCASRFPWFLGLDDQCSSTPTSTAIPKMTPLHLLHTLSQWGTKSFSPTEHFETGCFSW